MKLKTIAAAAAVALTTLSSHASNTDWGSHALLEVGVGSATNSAIFDTFTFSLGGSSTVASSVVSFGTVVGGAYSLYSYGADNLMGTGDDMGVGAWTFSGTPVVNTVSLTAGNYYYSVLGGAMGSAQYVISSAATAAPVPEPETYALLAAGLGIIGFVSSRRRRDDR
jgi:PEP-CTERM motif